MMTRPARTAALLLTLLLTAVAVRATSIRYQERRRALEAEAQERRKKLGLEQDRAKLYAQFPTPEVTFQGGVQELQPGATATVEVTGALQEGARLLFACDEVSVLKESRKKGGWSAQVRVDRAALPGDCTLHVLAPVSLAESASRVLEIRGRYQLDVRFEDGTTAAFTPERLEEGTLWGSVAFKAPGEKLASRTRKASLAAGEPLVIEVLPGEEELLEQQQAAQSALAALGSPAFQKAQEEAVRKMEACGKLPQDKLAACMQEAGQAMAEAQKQVSGKLEEAKAERARTGPKGGLGCTRWSLRGAGGKVWGEAACGEGVELKVGGTIRLAP
jgi:hypothetical protein